MTPGRFRIEFERHAQKDLESLEKQARLTILEAIQEYLSDTPFQAIKTRIKKMDGFRPTLYRLRIGDYRVYYRITDRTVGILGILHKKESKRWLRG